MNDHGCAPDTEFNLLYFSKGDQEELEEYKNNKKKSGLKKHKDTFSKYMHTYICQFAVSVRK